MITESELLVLARRVDGWADATITIEPLHGGITNRNFVATVDGIRHVLRVPGERTELLGIDRANEAEAASRAAELGIGPAVAGVLPEVDTLVTRMVGGRHLPAAEFVAHVEAVVGVLATLHGSGPLRGQFPIHRVVEWHARDAAEHGVAPPPAYDRLQAVSRRIEQAFAAAPMPAVACHNDLLPANVLVDDSGPQAVTWLIDYEYAGMNDPFFDLANLSVNSAFDDAVDERVLRAYSGSVTRAGWGRLQLMKVMSEFREGMWAVVQQAISTLDTDFVTYADERLANCERLAASADFARWLDDAARRP